MEVLNMVNSQGAMTIMLTSEVATISADGSELDFGGVTLHGHPSFTMRTFSWYDRVEFGTELETHTHAFDFAQHVLFAVD